MLGYMLIIFTIYLVVNFFLYQVKVINYIYVTYLHHMQEAILVFSKIRT